jgi:6-phosphofructokinase 1
MRVGVLTGGGDCPGLNAVIRAVVRKGVQQYGYEFVGFRDGWRGPLEGLTRTLDVKAVRGILPRGGTILGSSRTNPVKIEGGVERIKENLANLGVDALVAIGGEDTLGVATALHAQGVQVVGVPKTIDNDLNATDYTFGFDTAVTIATEAIDRLHTTAESHHRVLVIEVMGRHAGWIALHSGIAGGANVILIPEEKYDIEQVCDWVESRFKSEYAPIVVVSEGATPTRSCSTRRSTPSATSASAASASGWRRRSRSAPARSRAPRCSATCSAAARRPRGTAGWPPASACTRSTRSRTATGARWSRCRARTSSASR